MPDRPRDASIPGLAAGVAVGGQFSLVRRIGAGGMAEVWLARDVGARGFVALKIVRSDVRTHAHERLEQEAAVGARLAHPNLVHVLGLVDGPAGTRVLVMERLRGEALGAYIARRGPAPAADAVAIMARVLSALEVAHAACVLHRDVTPHNVFLAVDGGGRVVPKLLDFGIARVPGGVKTVAGDVLGTPQYLAPERIRGAVDGDPRSDLFAVGVVLYEMITGTSPFEGSTPAARLAAVLEVDVLPDPRIPPRLWFVLRRALAKDASERPSTAAELRRELLEAVDLGEVAGPAVDLPGVAGAAGEDDDALDLAGGMRGPDAITVRTMLRARRSSRLQVTGALVLALAAVVAVAARRSTIAPTRANDVTVAPATAVTTTPFAPSSRAAPAAPSPSAGVAVGGDLAASSATPSASARPRGPPRAPVRPPRNTPVDPAVSPGF